MALSASTTLALSNGVKVPQLGFGVYKSVGDKCFEACKVALEAGYRHIDSAQFYDNEAEVGRALKQCGLPRKDVFVATKILVPAGSVDASYRQCIESVKKMDSENGYVDLFMIHSPSRGGEKIKEMWQALERLHEEGKAKSIGVSNFGIQHIEGMKSYAKVWPPHVNQIELHPWSQQRETVDYCKKNNILVEAYCPLVRNQKADDPTLKGIADKHNATTNQVLVRYCLQKGWSPLPKSETPERIRSNMQVFGFDLSEEDMKALDDLNQGPAGAIVEAVEN
ncbi:aldo/keto reductase family protein [Sarocladium implicatum]|nr:aldo/keto reductase family protein [Sarocladium implicatum]